MKHLVQGALRKYVPTDMDWHPCFRGGYVRVAVYAGADEKANALVVVSGADDTSVSRVFHTWEEALVVFNRTRYLQSFADLADFMQVNHAGCDHNGWPVGRHVPRLTSNEHTVENMDTYIASRNARAPEGWGQR